MLGRAAWMSLVLVACADGPTIPTSAKTLQTRVASETETASGPTVLAEARLIRQMQQSLERGDVDGAWDAVIDHEQRFPEGELWPDREVFAIAVLVQQGESREAQIRAETFLETHENCAHGQRVKFLIAGLDAY